MVVADSTPHPISSAYTRFWGRRVVVVADNTLHPKSSARRSISGVERGSGVRQHTALEIEHVRSISRLEVVAKNMLHSKSSTYRGRREVVVMAPPCYPRFQGRWHVYIV